MEIVKDTMKHVDHLAAWKSYRKNGVRCFRWEGAEMRQGCSTLESLNPTPSCPHYPFCTCIHGKNTCQIQLQVVYEAYKSKWEEVPNKKADREHDFIRSNNCLTINVDVNRDGCIFHWLLTCLISPWAVKTIASNPSSVLATWKRT